MSDSRVVAPERAQEDAVESSFRPLSLDEFVITWFNIGSDQTLPVLVWGLVRRGVDPSINAMASILLGSMIFLVVVSSFSWRGRRA